MTVQGIGLVYVAIGAGLALIIAVARGLSVSDAALMCGLWPMYAPFVLLGGPGAPADTREAALVDVLARTATTRLATALPSADASRELARRLRDATRRTAELEVLLARPDMAPERLPARTAATIRQLRALRDRYQRALAEVSDQIGQLATQVELVRVQPDLAPSSVELVCDLVARIDGLAELAELDTGLE